MPARLAPRAARVATVISPQDQIIPPQRIEKSIFLIRGQKVMLDADLADLYQVSTKLLNQAVKRNVDRFPADFMFQLTPEEFAALSSQIVTLESGRGRHRKYLPRAFTEQGVAMLSSVLRSKRAVSVNIEIMRAFVRLREILATHKDLANKLEIHPFRMFPLHPLSFLVPPFSNHGHGLRLTNDPRSRAWSSSLTRRTRVTSTTHEPAAQSRARTRPRLIIPSP
jgi:hypothetical protein